MATGKDQERDRHPIEDIRNLAESMCRIIDGPRGVSRRRRQPRAAERALSLKENGEGFVISVALPEVAKKDLHVNVAEKSVTIFGHWSKEVKLKDRLERVEQMYSRLVDLPGPVDADKARASFKDRLLTIRLPRARK